MTEPNQKELEWYRSELDPTPMGDDGPSSAARWGVGAAVAVFILVAIALGNYLWG